MATLTLGCKSDPKPEATDEVTFEDGAPSASEKAATIGKGLTAKLDRLKIRTDSTMSASTATVISEGDTLLYLDQHSTVRENLKLRGKYYHEPWLLVNHPKSGKSGWVYGGAVDYEDKALHNQLKAKSPLLQQVYADDLEWEGTVPTGWQTATIRNSEQFKLFMIYFKSLVAKEEHSEIANMIRYPLKDIKTKQEFISNAHRILTPEVKQAVADQRLDRIFRNSGGASIGNGEVWLQEVNGKYRITAINFKGLSDISRDLMKRLSGTYLATSDSGKYSLRTFRIKDFLELTLNHQGQDGFPLSQGLGKYRHETSHAGQHAFVQVTTDSIVRRLSFTEVDSVSQLEIDNEPLTQGLSFIRGAQ